jgi:hypothetical protein
VSGWGNFAVVTGAAAAALLGLLFVAVSIRVETIARSAELRNRSAQTLTLLLTGKLVGALLTVPDQRSWELGADRGLRRRSRERLADSRHAHRLSRRVTSRCP